MPRPRPHFHVRGLYFIEMHFGIIVFYLKALLTHCVCQDVDVLRLDILRPLSHFTI